nr:MAG TPA: hypothetical protein [Caudoviricetes sp.]
MSNFVVFFIVQCYCFICIFCYFIFCHFNHLSLPLS